MDKGQIPFTGSYVFRETKGTPTFSVDVFLRFRLAGESG